jgi:hypothetical protein
MADPLEKAATMSTDDGPLEEVMNPVDQAVVPFYGHELVAARLVDGRIAAVLRWLCEGMGLEITAQQQRICRKAAPGRDGDVDRQNRTVACTA